MPPRARGGGGGRGGGRGGGAGVGRGGAPPPGHQPPAAHITTVGVRRPQYGTNGRPITINVNSFATQIPEGSIYHYDVISADKNMPAAMNMRIIDALQKQSLQVFSDTRVVFDGRKNLFAPVKLNLGGDSREFDVTLPNDRPNVDRPPRIYKVRLTLAATINTEILHRFVEGKQSQDNAVSTALMALNVVIRMEPSQKFPTKGRSFFTPQETQVIGQGLVLWRGYFQSIRPAIGRMLINVDISTGLLYQPGPLINLCLSYLQFPQSDVQRLTRAMPDRFRIQLQRFIAGIRVLTKAATDPPNAQPSGTPRVVRKLTKEGANECIFTMRGGRTMSVADYFHETSGRPLKFPNVMCVEVGQGALIPLELCLVPPGQLVRKEVPDDLKTQLVEFATMRPANRLESIKKGLQVLAYGQSEYVRKFGMSVSPELLTTQARVLQAPRLQYGATNNPRAATVNPSNGSWNMADKRLFRPATIATWVLIILENMGRFNEQAATEVSSSFVAGLRSTGITITDPNPIVRRVNGQGNIPNELQIAGAECFAKKKVPPTLFVVILPEGGNELYNIVKHWGDVTRGVATQCLKSRKCTRAKIQFWANVALKVNVKLGGINVITDPTQSGLSDPHNPTVVMGADVMHPAAGTSGRPSFAAVVSSVDSNAAKYIATQKVQASRQELITDLQEMVKELLEKYMGYRKAIEKVVIVPPKRLIFYRDGVSEGQFQQVLDQELPLIKAACQELKIAPKITLVIVGKRHHVRLFPTNERDADRSGNCPAGTVVDRDIGHPTEFDFYLQSHGGLLGTSRPAHYSVLYDDNNFNADAMQSLSFALCHVYAGSTRSVSIPAPVYYADKVCARAKIHYNPSQRNEWSDSGTATDVSESLEAFKRDYMPLHDKQKSLMYFS
ncbi:argonaute-like protein [Roridomyces roridus]|uniref:Argonaute-like protein n=1 Tax=Roridomyces roridus TaxID=1738132 RepID=A0AAD7FCJ9_9AGAR|nr:argonaute-like protein [Roridomyces roridus]